MLRIFEESGIHRHFHRNNGNWEDFLNKRSPWRQQVPYTSKSGPLTLVFDDWKPLTSDEKRYGNHKRTIVFAGKVHGLYLSCVHSIFII